MKNKTSIFNFSWHLHTGIEIETGSQTEGAIPAPDSHVGTIKHNGSVEDVPKETEFKDDAVHVTAVSYETSLDTPKHENLGRKVELDAYLVDEDHSNSSNLYLDDVIRNKYIILLS